jgi:hypothetical protein
MTTNLFSNALRTATLSLALIAAGSATALADPPGYYFQDEWQPRHVEVQAAPSSREVAMQNNCDTAGVGKPMAANKLGDGDSSNRLAASNRASLGAVHARPAR